MEPTTNRSFDMPLPPPVEAGDSHGYAERQGADPAGTPEVFRDSAPLPPVPPAQLPQPAASDPPVFAGDVAQPATPSDATSTTPQLADDADLIEKAWVEKAKEIVNKTKHDPYLQNKEINKIKADYMKKRYNKDIKLAQE